MRPRRASQSERSPAARQLGGLGRVPLHHHAGGEGLGGLVVLGVHPDVADVREGEGDDLPGVGGIGHDLLVAGHRGVEAELADRDARRRRSRGRRRSARRPARCRRWASARAPARRRAPGPRERRVWSWRIPRGAAANLGRAAAAESKPRAIIQPEQALAGAARKLAGTAPRGYTGRSPAHPARQVGVDDDPASGSRADLKDAIKARDSLRVSTLRLITAAVKDRDIAARTEDNADGRRRRRDPRDPRQDDPAAPGERPRLRRGRPARARRARARGDRDHPRLPAAAADRHRGRRRRSPRRSPRPAPRRSATWAR